MFLHNLLLVYVLNQVHRPRKPGRSKRLENGVLAQKANRGLRKTANRGERPWKTEVVADPIIGNGTILETKCIGAKGDYDTDQKMNAEAKWWLTVLRTTTLPQSTQTLQGSFPNPNLLALVCTSLVCK